MRISDWSSDVCSSDVSIGPLTSSRNFLDMENHHETHLPCCAHRRFTCCTLDHHHAADGSCRLAGLRCHELRRSEEHTSELQSLMRISYAVFCLKKKTNKDQSKRDEHTYTRQCI